MKPKLILDFDGTLTDVEPHFPLYKEGFEVAFSGRVGISRSRLDELVASAQREIEEDPCRGWEYNGVIVAPAKADPYIMQVTTYQDICKKLGIENGARDVLLGECYGASYAKCPTSFKRGLEHFLDAVQNKYEVAVVTNSAKEHVARVLGAVGFPAESVFGGARKFAIDPTWMDEPISVHPTKFPRPVMLRRKDYATVLRTIGASPDNTTVMGDIYELDLALPDHCGMKVVQMVKECTPKYEIDYMGSHPRGHIVKNLEEAKKLLSEVHS